MRRDVKNPCFPRTSTQHRANTACSGDESANMDTAPIFTEARIEALRNHLRVLVKALKASYAEATAAEATQSQREDANLLVVNFIKSLEDIENEYRKSIVATDDVAFAANGLLSELQVYRAVIVERYPKIDASAPSNGIDAAADGGEESSETATGSAATAGNPATAPESGTVPEKSNEGDVTTTVLNAVGEKDNGAFALPRRPPATPRTP